MKEYLKMANYFHGQVSIDASGFISDDKYSRGSTDIAEDYYGPICHAINSHDELVQMNKELLEALEWSDSQIMEFISVAFRHAEILGDFEISDVRDALNLIKLKAIAKAKGGAA